MTRLRNGKNSVYIMAGTYSLDSKVNFISINKHNVKNIIVYNQIPKA